MGEPAEKVISLPQALTGRMLGTDELNICEFPLATTGENEVIVPTHSYSAITYSTPALKSRLSENSS